VFGNGTPPSVEQSHVDNGAVARCVAGVKITLTDQVVVVTGAGRGIGETIAKMSAEAGAKVVLAARSADQLDRVVAEIEAAGGTALAVPTDVTDEAAQKALIKAATDAFGRLDVLVNNAGTNYVANLVMSKDAQVRNVYDVNVFPVVGLSRLAVRAMIRQKSGRIINVSSVSAKVGAAYYSAYASSKAAILGLTKSVALEVAKIGITVNAICPWFVETDLVRDAMGKRAKLFGKDADTYLQEVIEESPQKRLITAREVGGLALFLMSPEAQGITGQSLNVCGGVSMGG